MKKVILFLSMITLSLDTTPIIVSAHRGASGYEPENTLRAFKRAIDMGAPMIELDVHICKTGQIVVVHDGFIDTPKKAISDLTWDELQRYDMGKGERIPLLSQVFDLVDKRIIINVELKGAHTAKPVAELIAQYIHDKKWSPDNFLITSFNHYWVHEFHAYVPSVKTGILFECNPIGYAQMAIDANAQYAVMHYQWLTQEFVADADAHGIQVFVYTVNDKLVAEQLKKLNVDGIISNYPDILSHTS